MSFQHPPTKPWRFKADTTPEEIGTDHYYSNRPPMYANQSLSGYPGVERVVQALRPMTEISDIITSISLAIDSITYASTSMSNTLGTTGSQLRSLLLKMSSLLIMAKRRPGSLMLRGAGCIAAILIPLILIKAYKQYRKVYRLSSIKRNPKLLRM